MTNLFIKPCEGRTTSPFGWRIHPIRKERQFHKGIDLAKPGLVPIHASADGVVTRTGELGTYGFVVMIVHKIGGKIFETNYAHLKADVKVIVGQKVKQGDIIAYMGNTGGSSGQHLHFEIHEGRWSKGQPNAVDPAQLIGDVFKGVGIASIKKAVNTFKNLKRGDSGAEVKRLQDRLIKAGFKLKADSSYGPATEDALKAFQKANGLTVDGSCGPATNAKLENAISK